MGKRKYISLRKANSQAVFNRGRIPNVVPYSKLSNKINSIDVGELIPISPSLTVGETQMVDGVYRNCCEFILRLAKFYFNVDGDRADKLKSFDDTSKLEPDSFVFYLCFGGDGAPCHF